MIYKIKIKMFHRSYNINNLRLTNSKDKNLFNINKINFLKSINIQIKNRFNYFNYNQFNSNRYSNHNIPKIEQ